MEVENRTVVMKGCINGHPSESDFELKNSLLALKVEEGSKDVITKNLCLSIDPYHINRMKEYSQSQEAGGFADRQEPGQVIAAFGVGRVLASGNEEFKKDDVVVGLLSWEDYTVVRPGTLLTKIDTKEFPLSYHVGVLGPSGLTAYAGLYEMCKPKAGEKVFVSAASGSVGNLVGQFAKLSGCYVVGCAGSKQKVDMLKAKLGFDDAFNYKEEKDMKAALKRQLLHLLWAELWPRSVNEEFKKHDLVVRSPQLGGLHCHPARNTANEDRHQGVLAFAGLYDICKPKVGEKVFISAASGLLRNLVGQFAKLSGCHVVECTGSKKKVDILKENFGFNNAFNYKEGKGMKAALKRSIHPYISKDWRVFVYSVLGRERESSTQARGCGAHWRWDFQKVP